MPRENGLVSQENDFVPLENDLVLFQHSDVPFPIFMAGCLRHQHQLHSLSSKKRIVELTIQLFDPPMHQQNVANKNPGKLSIDMNSYVLKSY